MGGTPRLSQYPDYLGMPNPSPELLHGTLDALVLKTLGGGRRHGYAIARAIEEATEGVVEIEEGSLYPALYRMEKKGWIEAEWGLSELGRRAKFYRLTPRGRRQLAGQTAEWARFAAAITRVLLTS
jgi:PadR family transcriptional regulator PadR